MTTNFEITTINRKIYECLLKGALGSEPIEILLINNVFVPKEGWLWDYKECLNIDNISIAKTILQIVSFYNTFGGYLIYGVKEITKDKEFAIVPVDFKDFNPAQLRDKIKEYTSTYIDLTFKEVKIVINGKDHTLGLLYVPKRQATQRPLSFSKNGPEKSPGKLVFSRDDTYFRLLDECKKASLTPDWQILLSLRNFDAANGLEKNSYSMAAKHFTYDLPDKNLICTSFVGRDYLLSRLWQWLADELEYVKILSGDGGKGKTSIAYEFCRTLVNNPPPDYERILWLSVKEKQFSGITNTYYNLYHSDFIDANSFLRCIAENCALNIEDYENISERAIKKELIESLPTFPSLIIVDDLDSLDDDEQKKVVDSCRQLGSMNVRFLITTRKKLAYSSDLCLDVPGLSMEEFELYVASLKERYKFNELRIKDIKKLHDASDGSPLLSASILRLYKQGMDLSSAIKEWSGQAGEDARNAALKREIESLSSSAKRILLIISYFKNCSFTELKQAAGIEKIKLVDCLEELQSLFLVNEPQLIKTEQRFSLSNTTSLIVSSIKENLAYDYSKLFQIVKSMKESPSDKKSGNTKRIGLAINQSIALLKENRLPEALETIDKELSVFSKNPDLLLIKARCLMSMIKPDYEASKSLLRMAIDSGQKRELAYDLWYRAENTLEAGEGIIEVSTKALSAGLDKNMWQARLASGFIMRAKFRDGEAAINDLMDASKALSVTLHSLNSTVKSTRIEDLGNLHDSIWKRLEQETNFSWLATFDKVIELIKRGDTRSIMYIRAHRCLVESKSEGKMSFNKEKAHDICINKFINIIDTRSQKDKDDRPFNDLLVNLWAN